MTTLPPLLPQRLLILAPHTDDGEIGAGGFISSLPEETEKLYIAFSSCEESLPEGLPANTLEKECLEATKVLGIPANSVNFLRYPVRHFSDHRQSILEKLISVKKSYDPDVVLTPASTDIHQDHATVAQEAKRAFKDRTILGYELPWNCFQMEADFFVPLKSHQINKKISAVQAYESQGFRGYGDGNLLCSFAELRGGQIGELYAEAFEVMRFIWR